jgi:diguanylate cyclase (GGDEF)-like protein
MDDPFQTRPPWRLRVSLAARLGLGFAAIAIVVLLGQTAAQRDMHKAIDTLTRTQAAEVPISRVADALTYHVVAFDRAVLAQIRTPTSSSRAGVAEAELELQTTLDSYANLQQTTSPEVRRFRKEVQEHTQLGRSLIEIGAQRSEALGGIRDALDQLSRRISTAFSVDMQLPDPALARRAYAELELELGRLRTAFNDYLVSGSETGDTALRAATRSFRGTVSEYREELARSPGRAWLELVEDDLGRVEDLRRDIAGYDASIGVLRGRFAESGLQLPLRLDAAFAAPASRAVSESAGSAVNATLSAEQAIQRLTYLVLAVTLLVSLLTVLAVTQPVRRLTRATRLLARGGRDVRVAPGGSRELDELAEAFNQMSGQLAAADEEVARHRRELESRVRTRTRKLTHLANHDPLTGLPNRRFAFNHLRRAARSASQQGQSIGLIVLDIDNFKVINDNCGHGVGDLLLRAVAERLRLLVGERRFIARLGGDEFIVLLEDARLLEASAAMTERIVNAFRAPLSLDGREILVSVSVGVARLPEHASDSAGLVRAADAALFRAKELGRNCVATFSHALLEGSEERFSVEQSLRRSIDAGELAVVFQPQVSMLDGTTDVVEALLRWQRTDGPLVPASEFIAIAERSGLIIDMGQWALEASAAAVAQWRAEGLRSVRVAINVSVHQLLDHRFAERLAATLAKHGLPAEAIELELTESAFQTSAPTVEALKLIQEGGPLLALDDFGTGYSSLTSLSRLPLRRVKLDRSVVADAPANGRAATLARLIIGACQNLGLGVTVEGIERHEQLAWLSGCGPVHAQGFLVGRPMSAAEVPEFVRSSPGRMGELLARAQNRAGAQRSADDPVVPFRRK